MNEMHQVISDATARLMTAERVAGLVEKHVDDLIKSAVRDELSSYGGTTGKLITEKVKESLRVDDLQLPEYGLMVARVLEQQIAAICSETIAGELSERMKALIETVPKSIKLSEIVENMVKDKVEDGEYGDLATCIVEHGDRDEWVTVYLSGEPDEKTHNCDVRMRLYKGKIHSAQVGIMGSDIKDHRFMGIGYGLEATIQMYYAGGTIIELDEDEVSTYRDID